MKNIYYCIVSLLMLACVSSCNIHRATTMERWLSKNKGECMKDVLFEVKAGDTLCYIGKNEVLPASDFTLEAMIKTSAGASAALVFGVSDSCVGGYEIAICNGQADGSIKTGSLKSVRNLYKSMASDDTWFNLQVMFEGNRVAVFVDSVQVVDYIQPENPYRIPQYANRIIREGGFMVVGHAGEIKFKDMRCFLQSSKIASQSGEAYPELTVIDEQTDPVIRLQQQGFPVIDYHVHLKGWSKEQAHARSMNYGINYGIAPNCGIGFPITDDAGVQAYRDTTSHMPFFFGMQGEGREWVTTFSKQGRDKFDYVFTDAMTFTDHKGRRTRLWIPEETFIDIPQERYMDIIVDRIVKVLNEEPIDIYVNPCFVPEPMQKDYDKLWTKQRIDKVVSALKANNIVLEINARYKMPNFAFIRAAKEAGLKFTFGTNNANPEIGKLEYCIQAIDSCGITASDIWFPSQKKRI